MKIHWGHAVLDTAMMVIVCGIVSIFWPGGIQGRMQSVMDWSRAFPNHYDPVFDFVTSPMDPVLAVIIWVVDVYFLLKTYVIEGPTVVHAHKKFAAHGTKAIAAIHGIGSVLELTVGMLAILALADVAPAGGARSLGTSSGLLHSLVAYLGPYQQPLCQFVAVLALVVNVPTALVLNPGVWGVKHLTVPGFFKFAVLRTMESYRVLMGDYRLLPNLWILLQVGTVVRLLGYFILPYTSVTSGQKEGAGDVVGRRGDLFTEPVMYSFNILLSGYLTAAFVYPPKYLLGSLGLYAAAHFIWPPRVSARWGVIATAEAAKKKL